jgi:hypothetical protein
VKRGGHNGGQSPWIISDHCKQAVVMASADADGAGHGAEGGEGAQESLDDTQLPTRTWSSDLLDGISRHTVAVERLGCGVAAHAAYVAQARHAGSDDSHASSGGAAATDSSPKRDAPFLHECAAQAEHDQAAQPPTSATATAVASAVDRVRIEQDERAAAAAKWIACTDETRKRLGRDPLFMRNGSQWKRFGGAVIDDLTESTPLIDARSVGGACGRG